MERNGFLTAARLASVAALALVVAVAGSRRAGATSPPTNLVGKIQYHSFNDGLGHGSQSTDASPTFQFTQSGGHGTINGTITLTFPEELPPANYDPTGTTLLFSQPWQATMSVQVSWTTPAARSDDDPKTVFDFELDRLDINDSAHSILNPNCEASLPDEAELNENTTYTWNQTVSCTFSSLPILDTNAFSPNPTVVLGELVDYNFGGDAASGFFIDGGVPGVSSSYQFGPATTDLLVDHLEVVQTVQDMNNSVPLVADKATVVRVFGKFTDSANPPADAVENVPAKLHGFHGSAELPGSPISPLNSGGKITVEEMITRDYTNGSWNFLVPSSWTDGGSLTLRAEVNPDKTVGETDYNNNTSSLTVQFAPSPLLQIAYLPVCYQNAQDCPSNAISTYDAMARKLYPIGSSEFLYLPLKTPQWIWPDPLGTEADLKRFLSFLLRRYSLMDKQDGFIADQLIGWFPLIPGQSLVGLSDPVWLGSTGRVSLAQDTSSSEVAPPDLHDAAQTLAHEIGHNLGLRHTDINKAGDGCGARDPNSDFYTFYTDHKAAIHEVGFDTLHDDAVPEYKKDLMSYCTPPGANIWISPFDYGKLIAGNLNPQVRLRALTATPSNFVVVSGSVANGGTSGQIDSVVLASGFSPSMVSDPSGNMCLRLSSLGGATLSKFCFTLTFQGAETFEPLATESFTEKIALPAGTVRISLEHQANVLDARSASAHAPIVSITSPHAGDSWAGVKTVTWTASDADNDPLTFAVLTSPDNGKTWLPMETDLTARQYTLDSAELTAGANTLIRVLASDGFNTTAATAGPFTVAPQAFVEATPELTFGAATAANPQTLNVLLTNRGSLDAHLTGYQSSHPQFGATAVPPLAIPADGSVVLPVVFTPASPGSYSATLTLATDDPIRASLVVALVGTSGDDCRPVATIPCVLPVSTPAPIVTGRR